MAGDTTDRDWELFGATDPYYGVITHERYRRGRLTAKDRAEFFRTGEAHVEEIFDAIRRRIEPSFSPKRALDFGCGVGRVILPLAAHAGHVVGADVSESMLAEARRNCEERAVRNVTLVKSDDDLSSIAGTFDFVHSVIVFQHIPVKRGERIFDRLLERLDEGGVGAVHFTYAKSYRPRRVIPWVKRHVPFVREAINLLRGRRHDAPEMQVNDYDLNALFLSLQRRSVRDLHVQFTDHGGDLGVLVCFRRLRGSPR